MKNYILFCISVTFLFQWATWGSSSFLYANYEKNIISWTWEEIENNSKEISSETGGIDMSDDEETATIEIINIKLFGTYKLILDKKLKKIDNSISDLPTDTKMKIYQNIAKNFDKQIDVLEKRKEISPTKKVNTKPIDVIIQTYTYMRNYSLKKVKWIQEDIE